MTRTKGESPSFKMDPSFGSHFFMLVGLGASHSPRKLVGEDNQTCSESSSELLPHSEPAFISTVVVMDAGDAAGRADTADITAKVGIMAGAARTLDHVDLVGGPQC
jgi:hypothetical protein